MLRTKVALVALSGAFSLPAPCQTTFEPVTYGSEWSMAASAGEWTVRSYVAGFKIIVACPRLGTSSSAGYLTVYKPNAGSQDRRLTAVTFARKGAAKPAFYPLTWYGNQQYWRAKGAEDFANLLRDIESMTLSDKVVLEGVHVKATMPSTESLETLEIFNKKCKESQ